MTRLTEMEAFATVVEQGGFTDAARKMGISKSAVSKHITALEKRLGTRLLSRTTRRVSPTEIGLAYYDRANRILNDAGEADALVAELHALPSGLLQVSAAYDFGIHVLSPRITDFLSEFPDISVNLELSDKVRDLVGENFDLGVRIGALRDSALRARKLTEFSMRLIASPSYLSTRGHPKTLTDLCNHNLLSASARPGANIWKINDHTGTLRSITALGGLAINDGQSLLNAAICGLGIAFVPDFLCDAALAQQQVVPLLIDLPPQVQPVHAVYPPGRFTQPKVRAIIDFLAQELHQSR